MRNFPSSLIPIGLAIIGLTLAPWIKLFWMSSVDKAQKRIISKGALITFSIVTMVFLILALTINYIGEYGVYLMMLDLIFGSWLGYARTQKRLQEAPTLASINREKE